MPDWQRWYLTAPYAAVVGWLATMAMGPAWFPVGAIGAMLPVWVYRSRGSRTAEHLARQMAYEIQDTVETWFGVATGILLVLVLLAQTAFAGFGEMLGVLGNQAAMSPLPIAYWATSAVSLVGLSTDELSAKVVGGFALIAFAIAYMVKEG